MKKYNRPIFKNKYVQQALKITLWEKFLLLFVPTKTVVNSDGITKFKKLNGKFYVTEISLGDFL